MNKLIVSILVIASSFVMIGCGGDNSGQTFLNTKTVDTVVKYSVKGSVVDGPISGAVVKIFGVDENSSILYGTTTTDENGSFSIDDIENLPAIYRVVTSDGKDNGVDTEADNSDESLGFEMSAIVERDDNDTNETNTSLANVSPATTLVDKIVEDGTMPLEEAQQSVAKSFGLDEDTVLAKLDNNKHSVGNKVGNLIGFLTKISPIEDKNIVIKAIVKLVVKKDINVKVSDTNVDIDNLDIDKLLQEVNQTAPANTISPNDMDKIKDTQELIKDTLVNLLNSIKTADSITTEEAKEATANKVALDALLAEIERLTSLEIDSDELKLLVTNTKETIKALLDDNNTEETKSSDNIDFVLSLIKENLDKDLSDVKKFVIKASNDYKIVIKIVDGSTKIKVKSKSNIKHIIKLIYKNCDINSTDKIKTALEDETILEEIEKSADDINSTAIVETGEMPDELSDELSDTLADQISDKIEDGNITADTVKTVTDNSVRNPELVEAIKIRVKIKIDIKIKSKTKVLSDDDNIDYIASKDVIKNIKINVKVRAFTSTHKSNCNAYASSVKNTLKSSVKIKIKVKTVKLNVVNLNDSDLSIPQELIDLLEKLDSYSDTDFYKSIYKIKIKIKKDFVKVKISIKQTVKEIDDNIEEYKEPIVIPLRTLKLPQPSLPDMPSEFANPIEVEI